jgi:pyruvate formate lyase activating enzyme
MGTCRICNKTEPTISGALGACLDCILTRTDEALSHTDRVHRDNREAVGLPLEPPRTEGGRACRLCVNECTIGEGERGYCGLGFPRNSNVTWYHEALPTNCVADWVCPGCTGAGYPEFSHSRGGPEYGHKNLAVFYQACSFDCLFCQNWHYRLTLERPNTATPEELASAVDPTTSCICYFGGDPSPQVTHALRASRLARKKNEGRILRVCWETNGTVSPRLLDQMVDLSIRSGGSIKFDLKAWDEPLNLALCGVTNKRTLANFEKAAARFDERSDVPLVVASTLLIPGYVETEQVGKIAEFIASVNPSIPYSLLGFCPRFVMNDLPSTSRAHARRCRDAALGAGLKDVRIGNAHLLGTSYP